MRRVVRRWVGGMASAVRDERRCETSETLRVSTVTASCAAEVQRASDKVTVVKESPSAGCRSHELHDGTHQMQQRVTCDLQREHKPKGG